MTVKVLRVFIFLLVMLAVSCTISPELKVTSTAVPTLIPTESIGPVITPTPIVTPTTAPSPSPTVVKLIQLPSWSLPEFNARYSTGDLALSPDGNYVAVIAKDRQDGDKTVWVWNAHDFTASLAGYQIDADAWSVAFSRDGRQLAIGCAGKIILMEAQTGRLITTIDASNAVVVELLFGTDHTLAFSDFNDSVTIWDLTLNKMKYSVAGIAGFEPNHFAISRDGKWLVTADHSEIHIWDYKTGQSIQTRKGPEAGIGFAPAFAFSEDGRYLAVGGCSQFQLESCVRGRMVLWESDVLKLDLSHFPTRTPSLAFSSDNRYLAIAIAGDQVELLDLGNGSMKSFRSLAEPAKVPPSDSFAIYDMLFLTDRSELAVSTTDGIQLLDTITLSRIPNLSFRLRLNYPYIIRQSGDNLSFRAAPSLKGALIQKLHKGDGFNTLGGPVFADHLIWWKVKIKDGTEGWIIERPEWYEFAP